MSTFSAMDTVDIDYSEYSWIWDIIPREEEIRLCSSLPLDIARLVFEKALEFTPRPLHLLRVSHQVRRWLEPLVYKYVTLSSQQQLEAFYQTYRERRRSTTKDEAFFQRHVYTLFICIDFPRTEKLVAILQGLTGLRSLACWDAGWGKFSMDVVLDSAMVINGEDVFPYKHLRRISFTASLISKRGISFGHRAFRDLTHMDIYFDPVANWESLRLVHGLTHLSLDMATEIRSPEPDELPYWFSRILDACPSTVKVVIFGVVDEDNADFDLLDADGEYLPPGWPPVDSESSTLETEGWTTWLASESKCHDNVDVDILHPISRLALGRVDSRAVAAAVTDQVSPHQLFRELLVYFVWPTNRLDWDGMVDNHRDCWTVAEDIIEKRRGLTYAKVASRLTSQF